MARGRGRPTGSKDSRPRRRIGCVPDTASSILRTLFLIADSKGVSRDQLAEGMRCTATTISNWRHGVHSPDVLDLEALASLLGGYIEFNGRS